MGEHEEMDSTVGEIYLERARYLLSADKMIEEVLNSAETTSTLKMASKVRTVCCKVLVDADKAPVARTLTGEQFLVCNDKCRKFLENATPEQISEIVSR
jgi:hypothetical protein